MLFLKKIHLPAKTINKPRYNANDSNESDPNDRHGYDYCPAIFCWHDGKVCTCLKQFKVSQKDVLL